MTAAKPDTRLLTIPETAGRLACSRAHVYRLIADGSLGHPADIARPGARRAKTRVREDELARYIDGRTRLVPA
jgi:excisionase family DNA binding protein